MESIIKSLNFYSGASSAATATTQYHNGYEFIYAISGSATITINGVRNVVLAPAIVMLNPFESHEQNFIDGEYMRYVLVADSAALEREIGPYLVAMIKCRPIGFSHIIPLNRDLTFFVNRVFSVLTREIEEDRPYKEKMICNEIYNLLIMLYRSASPSPTTQNHQMLKIQKYIDDNYATIENVRQVADGFFISPEHFSRAFKNYSGYSPVEYLINTRLYNAQLMLLHTSHKICTICEATGFRDINNFTRQFKRKFGLPPHDFRKSKDLPLN